MKKLPKKVDLEWSVGGVLLFLLVRCKWEDATICWFSCFFGGVKRRTQQRPEEMKVTDMNRLNGRIMHFGPGSSRQIGHHQGKYCDQIFLNDAIGAGESIYTMQAEPQEGFETVAVGSRLQFKPGFGHEV